MKVTFKLYATLVQYLPAGTKGHAVNITVADRNTVQQLIDHYQIENKLAYLVMLNGIYIPPEDRSTTVLQENDTLAIWPKVAGG
jgi:thiamine biosynthesis protein ThiS